MFQEIKTSLRRRYLEDEVAAENQRWNAAGHGRRSWAVQRKPLRPRPPRRFAEYPQGWSGESDGGS